jgi:putative transcriptional regulator
MSALDLSDNFLIAPPNMAGDYFEDALIYLAEHTNEGAAGIVVNKPAPQSVWETFSLFGLKGHESWIESQVLLGGPVSSDYCFILRSRMDDEGGEDKATSRLILESDASLLQKLSEEVCHADILVSFGYCGWSSGQLEREISQGCWLNCKAKPEILFRTRHQDRMVSALEGLGISDHGLISRPGLA